MAARSRRPTVKYVLKINDGYLTAIKHDCPKVNNVESRRIISFASNEIAKDVAKFIGFGCYVERVKIKLKEKDPDGDYCPSTHGGGIPANSLY